MMKKLTKLMCLICALLISAMLCACLDSGSGESEKDSTPIESVPEESKPESVPEESKPESVPEESNPTESTPEESIPEEIPDDPEIVFEGTWTAVRSAGDATGTFFVRGSSIRVANETYTAAIKFHILMERDSYLAYCNEDGALNEGVVTKIAVAPKALITDALTITTEGAYVVETTDTWRLKTINGVKYMESVVSVEDLEQDAFAEELAVIGYATDGEQEVYSQQANGIILAGIAIAEANDTESALTVQDKEALVATYATFDVDYVVDGLTVKTVDVVYGGKINLTDAPSAAEMSKEGYTATWKDKAGNAWDYENGVVNNNLKLYPEFTANKYTLTIGTEEIEVTFGEVIGEIPTVEASQNPDFVAVWTIDGFMITADTAWSFAGDKTANVSLCPIFNTLYAPTDSHENIQLNADGTGVFAGMEATWIAIPATADGTYGDLIITIPSWSNEADGTKDHRGQYVYVNGEFYFDVSLIGLGTVNRVTYAPVGEAVVPADINERLAGDYKGMIGGSVRFNMTINADGTFIFEGGAATGNLRYQALSGIRGYMYFDVTNGWCNNKTYTGVYETDGDNSMYFRVTIEDADPGHYYYYKATTDNSRRQRLVAGDYYSKASGDWKFTLNADGTMVAYVAGTECPGTFHFYSDIPMTDRVGFIYLNFTYGGITQMMCSYYVDDNGAVIIKDISGHTGDLVFESVKGYTPFKMFRDFIYNTYYEITGSIQGAAGKNVYACEDVTIVFNARDLMSYPVLTLTIGETAIDLNYALTMTSATTGIISATNGELSFVGTYEKVDGKYVFTLTINEVEMVFTLA